MNHKADSKNKLIYIYDMNWVLILLMGKIVISIMSADNTHGTKVAIKKLICRRSIKGFSVTALVNELHGGNIYLYLYKVLYKNIKRHRI
jgi:hypothetical protein